MLRTNFLKLFLGIFMFSSVFGFYSCSEDAGPDDGSGTGGTTQTTLLGKYNLSDNDNYGSVEFTGDNKYIVTKFLDSANGSMSAKSSAETKYIIVIFGDYTVSNQSTEKNYVVDLQQFGTITINISDSGSIDVTINDGENTYNYTADKTEEVTQSANKTKLLCYTWKLEKTVEDGVETPGSKNYSLTFTTAGTYHFQDIDESDAYYGYGVWEWIDDKTLKVMKYADHPDDEDLFGNITILKLTEKELVAYEKGEDWEGTGYLYR